MSMILPLAAGIVILLASHFAERRDRRVGASSPAGAGQPVGPAEDAPVEPRSTSAPVPSLTAESPDAPVAAAPAAAVPAPEAPPPSERRAETEPAPEATPEASGACDGARLEDIRLSDLSIRPGPRPDRALWTEPPRLRRTNRPDTLLLCGITGIAVALLVTNAGPRPVGETVPQAREKAALAPEVPVDSQPDALTDAAAAGLGAETRPAEAGLGAAARPAPGPEPDATQAPVAAGPPPALPPADAEHAAVPPPEAGPAVVPTRAWLPSRPQQAEPTKSAADSLDGAPPPAPDPAQASAALDRLLALVPMSGPMAERAAPPHGIASARLAAKRAEAGPPAAGTFTIAHKPMVPARTLGHHPARPARPVQPRSDDHARAGYRVQVGSFLFPRHAADATRLLRAAGYAPYRVRWTDPERLLWHVVRLRGFRTLADALDTAHRIERETEYAAIVLGGS